MITIGTKVRVITSGEEGFHFFRKGEIVTRSIDPLGFEGDEFEAFQGEGGQVQVLEESDYELL